jgi:hypothetical protein
MPIKGYILDPDPRKQRVGGTDVPSQNGNGKLDAARFVWFNRLSIQIAEPVKSRRV